MLVAIVACGAELFVGCGASDHQSTTDVRSATVGRVHVATERAQRPVRPSVLRPSSYRTRKLVADHATLGIRAVRTITRSLQSKLAM
jgi:hypothetical protein